MTPNPYHADERITLYQADALAVLADLPSGSVDAVVTDPPYSSGGQYRGDRVATVKSKYVGSEQVKFGTGGAALAEFTGDNRDQRSYAYWCALWMGEALRVSRPGSYLLSFTDWRQLPSTVDAVQAGGWVYRGIVPWVKLTARPQAGRFTNVAEYVIWSSNGPAPVDYAAPVLPGFYQVGVPRNRVHITQKPVDLMRRLLDITPAGGLVLDPFMGSGTTGVAAITTGRRFTGVEQSEHHARVAHRRIRMAADHRVAGDEQDALPFDLGVDPAEASA